MTAYQPTAMERVRAAVPVVAIHALIAFGLLNGLGYTPAVIAEEALKVIDIAPEALPPRIEEPPPPPPSPGARRAERAADPRPEGAASPPNLVSRPTPIVAPPPAVPLPVPPPVTAAPVAGTGAQSSAGAAPVPGPGTGRGGIGDGTGSGRGGSGAGGGGGGGGGDGAGGRRPARMHRFRCCDLSISDLPAEIQENMAGGVAVVATRYAIEADGRVTDCTVTRSSGNSLLDRLTCRLIERNYRFYPAIDTQGRPMRLYPVSDDTAWEFEDLPPEPSEQRRRRRSPW